MLYTDLRRQVFGYVTSVTPSGDGGYKGVLQTDGDRVASFSSQRRRGIVLPGHEGFAGRIRMGEYKGSTPDIPQPGQLVWLTRLGSARDGFFAYRWATCDEAFKAFVTLIVDSWGTPDPMTSNEVWERFSDEDGRPTVYSDLAHLFFNDDMASVLAAFEFSNGTPATTLPEPFVTDLHLLAAHFQPRWWERFLAYTQEHGVSYVHPDASGCYACKGLSSAGA